MPEISFSTCDSTRARDKGFLRTRRDETISNSSARSKYMFCNPLLDNQLAFTAIRLNLLSAQSNFRAINTGFSVKEQEALKVLECFLSTVKVETISTKELYSIYIENLSRSGNLLDAACLLAHMHDGGIYLNLISYNILPSTAIEADDFDCFSKIFKSLLLSKQPLDFTSYVNVAKVLHKAAKREAVLHFCKGNCSNTRKITTIDFKLLASRLRLHSTSPWRFAGCCFLSGQSSWNWKMS